MSNINRINRIFLMSFVLLAAVCAASAQIAPEAFQQETTVSLAAGEAAKNVVFNIPAGKLMVIEQVSVYGSTALDQRVNFSLMTHVAPDNTYLNYYLLSSKESSSTKNYYTVSQQVKIYADVPHVYTRVSRSASPNPATFFFTVSGYLIAK